MSGERASSQTEGTPVAPEQVGVVVVAAGRGTRMGRGGNKVFLPLGGMPVLARTLQAFVSAGLTHHGVVVVGAGEMPVAGEILGKWCPSFPVRLVEGGADRQASVWQGLQALPPGVSVVLVHDGARPFVTADCLLACVEVAGREGAACAGMPVKDTIKRVDANGLVVETPDRQHLWQVQTPQGFRVDLLREAHLRAAAEGFLGTDDAMLVERLGIPVHMIPGAYRNLKLTTEEDLAFAAALLGKEWERPLSGGDSTQSL